MRRVLIAVVGVLALVAAGCDLQKVVPPGDAPLRYRDAVSTGVATTHDVVYGSAVDQQGHTVTLQLDVYAPAGDTVTERPAIVWIHGGSFAFGNKTSPEIVDEATTFAKKGFVNVSINYRLSSNGCTTVTVECLTAIVDAKHDAQAAVRFLRAHADDYGVDESRIATAGTSAGAITALNVGYGPEDVGDSGNPGFASTVRAAVSLSGARILTTPNPGEAAALLFHGTADGLVPYQWALDTVAEAKAAGLQAFLTTFEGAGHVPYTQNRTTILDQTTNFLYWTLDLTHAAR
ncbi:MAG TPA: alpha/beta hydrolase [Acidimicrobiales bacterium]|jgi:carboxylesterase type B|nr:alpha/beta hydrolase [Acidimicrobiales bacterium]